MSIKFQSKVVKSGGYHFVPIEESIAHSMLSAYGKRVKASFNGKFHHCAILRNKRIGHYFMMGKATLKKLNLSAGDEINIIAEMDDSEFQIELPESFSEVLSTDPEGMKRFLELTPGKQRSLIVFVSKAKSTDVQINRALKILDNLRLGYTDLKSLTRS